MAAIQTCLCEPIIALEYLQKRYIVKKFRDYILEERKNYITLSTGEYYPDILSDACKLYKPVLETFSYLLHKSQSLKALFKNISSDIPNQWMRIQLCRVFRKYVSPETPVELLKKSSGC